MDEQEREREWEVEVAACERKYLGEIQILAWAQVVGRPVVVFAEEYAKGREGGEAMEKNGVGGIYLVHNGEGDWKKEGRRRLEKGWQKPEIFIFHCISSITFF